MDNKDIIAVIAVAISLISIYMSWRNAESQGKLSQRLKSQDIAFDQKKARDSDVGQVEQSLGNPAR